MRPISSALTLISIVVLLAFTPILFGEFFAIGDIRDVYIPIESFFHHQQLAGNLPAWMPEAAWGFPVIASAQIGFFYPPLFILRFLPLPLYFPIIIIAHFIWMSLGTYLLMRKLQVSQVAALVGALSFSLGGFAALHLTHLNIILALSWLPWQFLLCYLLSSRPLNFRLITLLSFIFGIPFLAGQLQIPTLIAVVSSTWFIFLRYQHKHAIRQTLLVIILVAIGAFALASAQLLPSLELMSLSTRSSTSSFDVVRANQHSYPLYHLPTLIFPRFYANDDTYWGKRLQIEYGFYLGTIPLLLSLIGLLSSHSRIKQSAENLPQRTRKFFFYLLVISFLLSLGSLSPFRLIKLEPSLWVFSAPARWLLFTSFSLSFFASFGFDRLIKNIAHYKKYISSFLLLVFIVFIFTNLCLFIFDGAILHFFSDRLSQRHLEKITSLFDSAKHSSISFLSPYSYLPIASLILLLLSLKHKALPRIILTLAVAELTILFLTTTPTMPWSEIITPPNSINFLPISVTSGQSRLYSIRDGGDTGAYFTDPASRADDNIRRQQRDLFVPLTHSLYGLSGIEWPASLDLSSHATVLEKLKVEGSYAIADPIMAADLNIGAVLSSNNNSIHVEPLEPKPRLQLISRKEDRPIPYPINDPPSHLTFKITTDTDASVIIRDSFYPGWHAYINGNKEIPIQKYLLIFRRLFVPPGEHTVTLKYKPIPLYIGMFFTVAFLLTTLISHKKYLLSLLLISK